MVEYGEDFIEIDVSKDSRAVAAGRAEAMMRSDSAWTSDIPDEV